MTSIKLTQPLQPHDRIKVAQKCSAFLLLIYSIPDFVALANSEETMAVLS